jgi:hypothetical protein
MTGGSAVEEGIWYVISCIGVAGDQLRQVGRDIDRMRLEFLASVFSGSALEQWLIAREIRP